MDAIGNAIDTLTDMNPQSTDGIWLERLIADVASHIKEWDIAECYLWNEWPDREESFPGTTNQDVGIDLVARRRSDGEYIAIQSKARRLDELGRGTDIGKAEVDKFLGPSSGSFWAERWLVTNGDNRLGSNALQGLSMQDKPLKLVNIHKNLIEERDSRFIVEDCPHCQPESGEELPRQTKNCMQNEAVTESVRILSEHVRADSGGLPKGQARGKIVLPCGTGKTRISLRISEELADPGELAVVLCPSIALVSQIRREYLQHATVPIRALAVCSDQTAGYNPRRDGIVDTFSNPTADNSNVSASEVKGKVTTDPQEIADWITQGKGTESINVVFGTYQSGHRVAEALRISGTTVKVLIADEAHRTAGLRRKSARAKNASAYEESIRDFTLCHDNDAFPATYRIYQTATPKVFGLKNNASSDWIVRTMDDETVFGVELYRKSYPEAVRNGWLADYRIIALAVNNSEAYKQANLLASATELQGRKAITSSQYLRGLAFALAMGGATQGGENGDIPINSCIAFMNSVAKSQEMARNLQSEPVRDWVQEWLHDNADGRAAKHYRLEHLDARSNVTARDSAKQKLADADEVSPYGIINVGIFGEGTDSPSLNAVAFLEARKSPIDVIQAVGRAMRTSPGKDIGYIICPIMIQPDTDPEDWLSTSKMEEGWQELGQILLALRAHDQRIEDNLSDLLYLYIPSEPEVVRTIVAIAKESDKRISYYEHEGPPGSAQDSVERVLADEGKLSVEFERIGKAQEEYKAPEPTMILAGKVLPRNPDVDTDGGENIELRMDTVAREKPFADGTRGAVNIEKSKAKARKMINDDAGIRVRPSSDRKRRERRSREEILSERGKQMLLLSGLDEHGNAIKMNLLSKSGLSANRVVRDLNVLESSISEAAYHLRSDELTGALNRHFGLDQLNPDGKTSADGCTVAALLMMNAAMLHQRISAGRWMPRINDLSKVKNSPDVIRHVKQDWNQIMWHDFHPVFQPAIKAITAIENENRTSGLERALRHITAEAERIAETYADMGADHAGPLFNRVIGNQASDGAYFTRPSAASLAARLTLDVTGQQDWSDPEVWRQYKTVDLACGSGTLLAALLTDMKRRARDLGAEEDRIAQLQRLAVEDVIKGMDINAVSLQLAAAQLTAGNRDVRYRKMGLHLMPYGPDQHDPSRVSAGTLELLGQKAIIQRNGELDIPDSKIGSQSVWGHDDDVELEDAVDAARGARVVIMNPPFTNRSKMGEKFPKEIQQKLRARVDAMEQNLVRSDEEMDDFVDKNSIQPLFVALADHCVARSDGILTMVSPTIALSAPAGLQMRMTLAQRFHIHTVLTSHRPNNVNLSQNAGINESIVVMRRAHGPKPPTRFVNLDRMPLDEAEVEDLHRCLSECEEGQIENGWGEVSHWSAELMEAGDWTPAVLRSTALAQAANGFASHPDLKAIGDNQDWIVRSSSQRVYENFKRLETDDLEGVPILDKKGADGQKTLESSPDSYWITKSGRERQAAHYLKWASHLLVTAGLNSSTARLTASASDRKYLGTGWSPVVGLSDDEAKSLSVFINSTVGRLQLMRNPAKTLLFPSYKPKILESLKVPDIEDDRIRGILADCWERTKEIVVPQFRDGECEVRRLWDEAVAEAMDWDADELARLRLLLHQEPHVSGLAYGQYADEAAE